MNTQIAPKLSRLRYLVSYLGGSKLSAWWDCSFLDPTGVSFLGHSFPRTALDAALTATAEAAQRVHDHALGKRGCYHLFRLPIEVEEMLGVENFTPSWPIEREQAMAELATLADASIIAPEGPVQVGTTKGIQTETAIQEMAAHYHSAFSRGIQCYPYFSAQE